MFCREQLVELRSRAADLEARGVVPVPVVMATPEQSRLFWTSLELPFRAACSGDGAAHKAFGLRRGGPFALFGFRVLKRGLEAFRKGFRNGKPVGDVFVLPGAFVVDAKGRVVVASYGAHAGDHLTVDALLAAVDSRAL